MFNSQEKTGGADALHTIEFPLCLVSERAPRNLSEVTYNDEVPHPTTGLPVSRRLIVRSLPQFGLPTAGDDEVFVAMLKLTRDAGFASNTISFTGLELIGLMKWAVSGKSYARLFTSLLRWRYTSLCYERAWWNDPAKSWMDEHISVIQTLVLPHTRGRKRKSEAVLSSVQWGDVFFRSLQEGYWKPLDTTLYFSLRSAIARRLMRYCDVRFRRGETVEMDLAFLARQKIGLQGEYSVSKIRQLLDPAVIELMSVGFFEKQECEAFYRKTSRATAIVVFSPPAKPFEPLVAMLVGHGVSRKAAETLAETHSHDKIRRQVENLEARLAAKEAIGNPPGWLKSAIEGDFALPKKYEASRRRELLQRDGDIAYAKARAERELERKKVADVSLYIEGLTPEERLRVAESVISGDDELSRQYKAADRVLRRTIASVALENHVRAVLDAETP